MKRCCKCGETKELEQFNKNRSRKDGLQPECKACNAAHRAANREHIAAQQAAWRAENREQIAAQQATYRAKTRQQKAKYLAEYARNRRRTDPDFRLRENLRCRLKMAIRSNAKTGSAVRDLGCSIAELWLHLESQFQPGMTRENYGTVWSIDHIYPLTKAHLSDRVQFLAVNNWRNLQPMFGPENFSKNDAVTPEAQRLFDELVREFSQKGVA